MIVEGIISLRSLGFVVATECAFTRDLLHFFLESFQAQDIQDAASGAEARRLFRAGTPDVLLADMAFAGFGGPALVRQLRTAVGRAGRAATIVLLAYRPSRTAVLAAIEAGADDVLIFPFSAEMLARRVIDALVRRRRRLAIPPAGRPSPLPEGAAEPLPEPLLTPEEIRALISPDGDAP